MPPRPEHQIIPPPVDAVAPIEPQRPPGVLRRVARGAAWVAVISAHSLGLITQDSVDAADRSLYKDE